MINLIYKHNEDGSLKKSFEAKKIYLIIVMALVLIYFLNINTHFNNELNGLLSSVGLNIWYICMFFVAMGYFVFRFADRFDKK